MGIVETFFLILENRARSFSDFSFWFFYEEIEKKSFQNGAGL